MINMLKHMSTRRALFAAALFATATGALAQAPTEAQKSAIRSACSADVRSLCAGVAPGGGRIIQCISNNAASLSPACKDVLAPFAAR